MTHFGADFSESSDATNGINKIPDQLSSVLKAANVLSQFSVVFFPNSNQKFSKLSGGQRQRRIALYCG